MTVTVLIIVAVVVVATIVAAIIFISDCRIRIQRTKGIRIYVYQHQLHIDTSLIYFCMESRIHIIYFSSESDDIVTLIINAYPDSDFIIRNIIRGASTPTHLISSYVTSVCISVYNLQCISPLKWKISQKNL